MIGKWVYLRFYRGSSTKDGLRNFIEHPKSIFIEEIYML